MDAKANRYPAFSCMRRTTYLKGPTAKTTGKVMKNFQVYKKKYFLQIFAFCFLCCSCSEVPRHIELAHQIGIEFSSEVCKSENLSLVATGGELMDDIQKICLRYATVRACSISEARCLLVSLAENFLYTINANEQIRPYLHEFPFTSKNIEI